MNNLDHDVILASLKLARAMRRCPPERGEAPFPPAVGRLLACAAENPGVSSRELCELLDVRPSSLSEMLARAEADGLLTRTADEADKRVQRITLTEKGSRLISELKTARDEDARKKTSCLAYRTPCPGPAGRPQDAPAASRTRLPASGTRAGRTPSVPAPRAEIQVLIPVTGPF